MVRFSDVLLSLPSGVSNMLGAKFVPQAWKSGPRRISPLIASQKMQKRTFTKQSPNSIFSMSFVRHTYRRILRKFGVSPPQRKLPTIEEFEAMVPDKKLAWALLGTRARSPWDKTETLSRSLLRQLIESNYMPAKYTYATMVVTGTMRDDMSEAIKLLEECSRGGHSWAKSNLAQLLVDGRHVRQDLERAVRLYEEAWSAAPILSDAHAHTSALNLADLYLKIGNLRASSEWLTKAGEEAHDVLALYQLGHAYSYGKLGFDVDLEKARNYTQRAADAGLVLAQHNYGCLLYEGTPTHPPDYVAAAHYFSRAHYQEYYWSSLNLANMFARGRGVPQNYATALVLVKDVLAFGTEQQQDEAKKVKENIERMMQGQHVPEPELQMRTQKQKYHYDDTLIPKMPNPQL